jgi:hypothetical protein
MEMMKYFIESYFVCCVGLKDLNALVHGFKKEYENTQLKFAKELYEIIKTNNYNSASKRIQKYGLRNCNVEETKKLVNFLYNRLIERPTKISSYGFQKNCKLIFCPICSPNPNDATIYNLIEKAIVKAKDLQLYICKSCRSVWLTENIEINNAQNYKNFMKTLGLYGLWDELKDVDIL